MASILTSPQLEGLTQQTSPTAAPARAGRESARAECRSIRRTTARSCTGRGPPTSVDTLAAGTAVRPTAMTAAPIIPTRATIDWL